MTFKSFIEQDSSNITNFVQKEYPNINVFQMSHKDLVNWLRKEGVIPAKGLSADKFARNIRVMMNGFRQSLS